MTQTTNNDHSLMQCGYIKAKFALRPDLPLWQHKSYQWAKNVTRPRITTHFVYVSLGHQALPDNDTARKYIHTIKILDGKITRVDFCIDYLGKLAFDAFYKLHDNDEKPTPSIVKTPSGITVYVGKRSSARMLRVYDKRGEILAKTKVNIGFDMTRIELEAKRNMITRYVTLFMSGETDMILSDIQRLYGLRGFCQSHKAVKPTENREKKDALWNFVTRYKRIIQRAYLADIDEFLDIIGVNDNE